jgi:hypothetical protein
LLTFCGHHHWWPVPAGLNRLGKILYDLAVGDFIAKRRFDRVLIGVKSIGGQLGVFRDDPIRQVGHEGFRDLQIALADGVGGDQLCIGIKRDVEVLVAARRAVDDGRIGETLLLTTNERPNLVRLDVAKFQPTQLGIKQVFALSPDADHEPHDCVAVYSGQPLGGSDRITLAEQVNDLALPQIWKCVHGKPFRVAAGLPKIRLLRSAFGLYRLTVNLPRSLITAGVYL